MRVILLAFALVTATAADILLVVEKNNDSVGFYSLANGAAVASVKVGHIPHEFVFSADGKSLYVTNYGTARWTDDTPGGNSISIIDLKTKAVIGEIPLHQYRRPHGIELGHSGKLYVTCDMPSTVLIIDPLQRKIERAIPYGDKVLPHMLALTRDESKFYTANAGDGSITVHDLKTNQSKSLHVGGVPMGLALTIDERTIYVATRTANTVVEVDTAKWSIRRTLEIEGQPVRLQLVPNEKQILVSLIVDGAMAVVDRKSLRETKRLKVGLNAEGMHIDPKTNEGFVSAQGEKRIIRFSLTTFEKNGAVATQERPDPILIWRDAN
jgi:DNA-binding beta-propeller fold protein YncE